MERRDREHLRYAHEAAITLYPPGRELSGRTRNVSRGGLCATLAEEVAVGTEIAVDLQLVFAGDLQSEPLRLLARVVWCTSVDDGHQVGVSFLAPTAEATADLTMFLRYLDDSEARPAPPDAVSVDDRFD